MSARQYLEQVKKLDELISAKNEEKRRLFAMATDCTAKMPDGLPHGGGGLPSRAFENAVIELVKLVEEIDKDLIMYRKTRAEIVKKIEKLPAKEYGALHRHYIQFKPWGKVAQEMGYSSVQIARIHKNGLKMIANDIE